MRRRTLLIVLAAAATAACGDDPAGPVIAREEVAGSYSLSSLRFDPQGTLPEVDVLERMGPSDIPQLAVSAVDNTFQFVYSDPGGTFTVHEGGYELQENGIRLSFRNDAEAQRLLLPRRVSLTHNATARSLGFADNVSASLQRLRSLVPEFADEPLSDPVPGLLRITFTLQAAQPQ